MDYAKRYYLISPESWTRMMENKAAKTNDMPPGEVVKKDIQDRIETRYLQKNFDDETLASAGESLKKIGLLQPPAPPSIAATPPSVAAKPPAASQSPSKSSNDELVDNLKARAASSTVGNRIVKLVLLLQQAPGVDITTDKIIVQGNTLAGPTFQILSNLVKAEQTLLSDDSLVLLSVIVNNGLLGQLKKRKIINNKEAINYLSMIDSDPSEEAYEDASSFVTEPSVGGPSGAEGYDLPRIVAEPAVTRVQRGFGAKWLNLFKTAKKTKKGGQKSNKKCRKNKKMGRRKRGTVRTKKTKVAQKT